MEQTQIRMPLKLKETLRKQAREIGISLNALVLQILWSWSMEKNTETREREN